MDSEALVRRYFEAANTESEEELSAVFAGDAVYRAVGSRPRRGRDEIVTFFRTSLFRAWSDHRDVPVRIALDRDRVFVEVQFTGVARDGREISFPAVDLFVVSDGQIEELTTYYDVGDVRKRLAGGTA